MAVRALLDYTQPVLRRKAKPVARVDGSIRRLARDMRETMKAAPGVGLAAPQIGESVRVFVYDTGEESGCIINPELEASAGEQIGVEGCLSVPGLVGEVTRFLTVEVSGLDEWGRPARIAAEGYLARVLQHELDHLNGVLFLDRALPETLQRVPLHSPSQKGVLVEA